MIQLIINDTPVTVAPGTTVLEAARANGIHIPTLCYLKAIRPNQACRLCVVEAEGPKMAKAVFSSCDLIAFDGLVVHTDSSRILQLRRTIVELLLASMPDNRAVLALAEQYGITERRFGVEKSDSCLLCGICIQACREKIGGSALSFAVAGDETSKVTEFVRLDKERCVGCGTCANLCPAGAIQVEDKGAVRELSLYGVVVNTLELIACTSCGAHFTTAGVVDLLQARLAKDGLEVNAGYCPNCARAKNPAPATAQPRMQTGETA